MTFPVKWFLSTMGGAPRCSGTAGDLIALLDACLINGFNALAVQSLIVTSEVATATFASAHGYLQHQIITISGATPAELSGEWRVKAVPQTNTLTFDCPGVADGTATGTIGCKTSPVGGWEKVYVDTNKAAYRSSDIQGTGLYLRVDDTGTVNARIVGYESMSDVDNGLGSFPTNTQLSGGLYLLKSSSANTAATPWALVGDSRLFYTAIASGSYSTHFGVSQFGDIISFLSGDSFHCTINASRVANIIYAAQHNGFMYVSGAHAVGWLARDYILSATPQEYSHLGSAHYGVMGYYATPAWPNNANAGTIFQFPIFIREGTANTNPYRGYLPGVYHPLDANAASHGTIVVDSIDSRMKLMIGGSFGGSTLGRLAIDITGPWR
jgi:hypothetical protein